MNKLLINLLSKERSTNEAIQEQEEIYIKKKKEIQNLILLKEENI